MKLTTDSIFSISPNPNALFVTENIKATLHLTRSTINKRQGLVALLSDIGMGKTTVIRYLEAEMSAREDVVSTAIFTPNFPSLFAMVKTICADFDVPAARSLNDQQERLQAFLANQYKQNKNVVLFIDEAQMLKDSMLEMVRGLLNFETNTAKLIQVILAGQLEFWTRMKQEKHRPLLSRVHSYLVLNPLTEEELARVITHRCQLAEIDNPFTPDAVARLYAITKGVPRHALKICDKAYEYMQLGSLAEITADVVDPAAEDAAVEVKV
jgi:general secretion pathway protein A